MTPNVEPEFVYQPESTLILCAWRICTSTIRLRPSPGETGPAVQIARINGPGYSIIGLARPAGPSVLETPDKSHGTNERSALQASKSRVAPEPGPMALAI